ncbi:helix-turn-helix transcriptional regulator [Mannheimia indoligenes]|uniref:Helix-turn-helix transcriptional regulator n=1 Tax=Mannheimia indoligenes TaxID=3103145 RepID=A0ABU7ZF25_9PAST
MNKIAKFRQQIGISQSSFASEIGITQGALGHYESGRRTPSLQMARKIVTALNVLGANTSIDDVFPENKQ